MNMHAEIKARVGTSGYTVEERELIERMAVEGYSMGQVARMLGKTRSQIAGYAFRHLNTRGIYFKSNINQHSGIQKEKPARVLNHRPPRSRISRPIPVEPEPLQPPLRIQVEELKPRSCRWPFGDPGASDFGFCGHETHAPGQSYCAHHQRLAWHA
jgi:GcrA cell cycle regulator